MFRAAAFRIVVASSGLMLACAGCYGILASVKGGRIKAVSAHVRAGDRFAASVLQAFEPDFEQATNALVAPDPNLVRELAVIRLRQADIEVAAGRGAPDNAVIARAEQAVRASLRLMPTDGFLWFALAWLSKRRNGYDDTVAAELRMSYATAPHEGWIASYRSAMSVPLLMSLPDDLRHRVLREFSDLISSGYAAIAADILVGPGWGERAQLLDDLGDVPAAKRQAFATEVEARDPTIRVPGFVASTPPWRR